jgi:hypothetical protein
MKRLHAILSSLIIHAVAFAQGSLGTLALQNANAINVSGGAITNTTISGLTISTTTGTFTIADGKTLTSSNTLTLAGSDGSTLNIGAGGTLGTNAFTSTAFVPQTTTVNGHALSANVTVTASDVGLGSVTNDAQTKAAIVPNTAPSAGQILVGNAGGTAYAPVTMSGHATLSSAGALTIANAVVTNAMLVNMATQTFKGRITAGAGDPEDLTVTQATAMLNAMVGDSGAGGTKGLVPAPAAGDAAASKFLKADGVWTAIAGGGDMLKSVYDPQNLGYISGDNSGTGAGGYLNMDAALNMSGGRIFTYATTTDVGGDIFTFAGSGASAHGGDISTAGGTGSSAYGGNINTGGGTAAGANGGSINTSGATDDGGEIHTHGGSTSTSSGGHIWTNGQTSPGGSISTTGGTATNTTGGNISTDGGSASGGIGGNINTTANGSRAGGGINTAAGATAAGGSIDTSDGGGSVDTTGTGSIGFGANGTRTTVSGSASADRNQTLPDKDGTFAMTSDSPVKAWVRFDGTTAANQAATYERTGTTVTVTLTSHGYITGNVVYCNFTSGGALDGVYTITSTPTADTFTLTTAASGAIAAGSTLDLNRRLIKSSLGVHSVTYSAVGTYYVNFTTAFSDADYGFNVSAPTINSNRGGGFFGPRTGSEATEVTAEAIKVYAYFAGESVSTSVLSDMTPLVISFMSE